MATLTTTMTYSTQTVADFTNWAKPFGSAFSTLGWVNGNDLGSIQGSATYGSATITFVAIMNGLLQITFSGPTNEFSPGSAVLLTGLTTNTYLNNQIVRVTNILGSNGTSSVAPNTAYTLSSVAASVGSTAVYTGSGFSATANFYAGAIFVVTGFVGANNNGTFVCTASSSTTITLYNSAATAETHAATATQEPDRTNTTFNAYFAHADVNTFAAPGADTGTAAIVYNWNTVTNIPDYTTDSGTAAFPIGHNIRWRGGFVPMTPIFTNLQTTSNLTTVSFGANGHGLDLTYSKGLGLIVSGVANAAFTWLNTNPTGGWPITSLTSTAVVINTASSPRSDIASTAVTAGIAAPTYIGGNMVQSSAFGQYVCDVVTYNGDLYIASTTSYFSGATQVLPGAGTPGSKQWSRFAFDIWKSNDSLTSTNPICFKILYGTDPSSRPVPVFYWGCATDGSGNITTNYNWGPSQIINPVNCGANNTGALSATTSTTDTAQWESNFSGTSGRFQAILWRGYPQSTGGPQIILNIERSHDNSGNDTDAYWTVIFIGNPNNSGEYIFSTQQSIFKPGTGGAGPLYSLNSGNNGGSTYNAGAVATPYIPNASGLSVNNSIPVLPIFPLVGYVGNPMLGLIAMKASDTADGALVTASFYGTSHTYLMCQRGGGAAIGPFTSSISAGPNSAAGIRWE